MANKRKIINDPVFGFINIPNEFIYDVLQHPYVQRLNRIRQLGLSYVVYPGAQHSRFLHSIGAMHLMSDAIASLRQKGVEITLEEADGAMVAILLHDIGHAPFSHVMEHTLIEGITHEEVSLRMMEQINQEMSGALDVAIAIFKNEYETVLSVPLTASTNTGFPSRLGLVAPGYVVVENAKLDTNVVLA